MTSHLLLDLFSTIVDLAFFVNIFEFVHVWRSHCKYIFFHFLVRPGSPHNLRIIQARARSVVINFTPGPSGRAPILSYTVEYNNDSFYDPASSRWRILMVVQDAHLVWDLLPLTLPNLKPYTDYRFRVIASNKVGSSSPSNATDTKRTLETGA